MSQRAARASGAQLWPENSTYELGLPVISKKTMARPATTRPSAGVSRTLRRSTTGCRARALRLITDPRTAAATPMPMAHRNSAPVGEPKCGIGPMFNEKVP